MITFSTIYRNEEHLGHPVRREHTSIELARVPVNGEQLQDSIILHPRYVPKDIEHELFTARVYRRGRTLDLFLDEPIVVDGTEYGILNFKGVGADVVDYDDARDNQELIIHPDNWHVNWHDQKWLPRKTVDPFDRVWGALTKKAAAKEYPAEIFHQYGIRHAPHVALNEIPKSIINNIRRVHDGDERHYLVQLVRALRTNVRVGDFQEKNARKYHDNIEQRIEDVTDIDTAYINAQISLMRKGKMIWFLGAIEENRFIDGLFTDAENYSIRDLDLSEVSLFVYQIIRSSVDVILYGASREYYERLSDKTKIPFTLCASSERLMPFIDSQIRKKAKK